MSRTIEVPQTQTPVKAHVFFNGELGKLSVLRGENPELQELAFPFSFVVLDADTHKVGGKLGLGSNAVKYKSTLGHPKYGRSLKVWLENDPDKILASGTWGAIKTNPALSKARYTALIFAVADFGEGKETCCIYLHGRALSAWYDATQNSGVNPCGDYCFVIKQTKKVSGDKGADSLVPIFETGKISEETKTLAEQADFDLQVWLSEQFQSEAKDLGIGAAGATRSDAANATRSDANFPTAEPPTGNARPVDVPAGANAEPDDLPF